MQVIVCFFPQGYRTLFLPLLLIFFFTFFTVSAQEKKVKLLVIVDASSPLIVDYRTGGNTARQLLMMGSLLDVGISQARQSNHSKQLRNAVGPLDRFPILKAGIEGAFSVQAKYFDVNVTSDSTLGKKTKLDWDNIKKDTYPFVLVVNELFAGFVSAYRLGTLSAQSTLHYELFDSAKEKLLEKGTINGWSSVTHEFDEGVNNRVAFINEYGTAAGNAIGSVYGQLNKDGHLHAMADKFGLGAFVPALGDIIKKYESTFDINMTVPKGWSKLSLGSKYTFAIAPSNKDKRLFGLRFDIDLLIAELGQQSLDRDAYATIFLDRVSNRGYSIDPEATPQLNADSEWSMVVLNRPNNSGKEIVMFKKFGDLHMGLCSAIFYEDYEGFMTKYKPDIDSAIESLVVTIH